MATILIIEDSPDILNNVSEILSLAGNTILTAPDGAKGIIVARDYIPDLIISDISMPEMNGYEVLGTIRQMRATRFIPFIFMAGKSDRSEIRKGMEMGADDYISKPFSATELLAAVEGRLIRVKQSVVEPGPERMAQKETPAEQLLQSLTEDRNIKKYKKRQTVYTEGSHPTKLFYVLEGKIKTTKSNEEGKELVTGLYGPGDFLGYDAVLEGVAYKESAEAMEESALATIPREDFEELITGDSGIMQEFIRWFSKHISEKENQLVGLAYHSLRKKVADALVMVERKYNTSREGEFSFDINRDNLAAIAGIAKESLIRTLTGFKNEKLIDIKNGRIYILNKKKLEKLIN